MITKIPRMQGIADCIKYQEKHFDGSGIPNDDVNGKNIPLGARILKVVLDFDRLEASGLGINNALAQLQQNSNKYDPDVLATLSECVKIENAQVIETVKISELNDEMYLAEDIHHSTTDLLIVCKGQQATETICKRLLNLSKNDSINSHVTITRGLNSKVEETLLQAQA